MLRIGLAGTVGLGLLALKTLDKSEYEVVIMEPDSPCKIPKVRGLRRIYYFYKNLPKVDVVMFVFPESWTANALKKAQSCGKKTIAFWVGTDVYLRLKGEVPLREKKGVDLHLCVGERLQKELASMGVVAQCLFTPSDLPEDYSAMPAVHAVLLSIPDNRAKFYGYDYLARLIQDFPDTRFVVTRSQTPAMYQFPNVDFRGSLSRDQMDEAFGDTSIYIRFPEHDSIGLTVVEALIKGKQVICNYSFPYTHEAHTYEELRLTLEGLLKKPVEQNRQGHEFALAEYSQERCKQLLTKYLYELCQQK